MNNKNISNFEQQWLHKLQSSLIKIGKAELYDTLMESHCEDISWSIRLMETISAELSAEQAKNLMSACACLAPKDYLIILKDIFSEHKNIQQAHTLLQQYFEEMIVQYKNLDNDQLEYIRSNDMGMAGKLAGNMITAVKIPKDFQQYFQVTDPKLKRYHYCHCPRIREQLKSEINFIDEKYCYCGAGFYKDLWGYILQREVKVKIVDSVLRGDEYCKIMIDVGEFNAV